MGFRLLQRAVHHAIRKGLAAPRVPHERTPAAFGLPFEAARIATSNQRVLHAWFIPSPGGTTTTSTLIVMHGWGGNAAMMLPLARPLHDAGFATLFVDARCHGESDDDDFASLPRFAEDIESARAWLVERQPHVSHRVALLGHSVGAGAALLVASRHPWVLAVISVSAFEHPDKIMRRWLASKRIPLRPVGNYILEFVQKTIGFRFDDIAPINTIARVRCPVLLIHGIDDDVVPVAEAQAIHSRRKDERVELLLVHGRHDDFADLEHHLGQVITFLSRAVDTPGRAEARPGPECAASPPANGP